MLVLALGVVASAGLDTPKLKVGAPDVLPLPLEPVFVNNDFVFEVLLAFEKRLEPDALDVGA